MRERCSVCGNVDENVFRDGKFYCSTCGCEIEVPNGETKAEQKSKVQVTDTQAVYVQATCPICRNAEKNTMKDGKCLCSMCGSSFVVTPKDSGDLSTVKAKYSQPNYADPALRERLEKEKNKNIVIGVIMLLFCWPVSIIFFIKAGQISTQISKLQK